MTDSNCIFCKILKGDIPSSTVYEDEDFRVILDVSPVSRGHVLVIPREHYADVCSIPAELSAKVLPLVTKICQAMTQTLGAIGFNLAQNNGAVAGQTVFHFHLHIIPRYAGDEGKLNWAAQEADAEELKELAVKLREQLQK